MFNFITLFQIERINLQKTYFSIDVSSIRLIKFILKFNRSDASIIEIKERLSANCVEHYQQIGIKSISQNSFKQITF